MGKWPAVLAVVAAAVIASPGFAAENGGKAANIRKLIHITSGKELKEMTDQRTQASLESVRNQVAADAKDDPEVRHAFDESLKALSLGEKDMEEMVGLMVPYYDKYLGEDDVAALVAFYESPAAKNFIRAMPDMMGEMMPRLLTWQMGRLKAPVEGFRKKLEEIRAGKAKEKPAAAPPG